MASFCSHMSMPGSCLSQAAPNMRRRPLQNKSSSHVTRDRTQTISGAAGFGPAQPETPVAGSHLQHIPAAPDLGGKSVRASLNPTSLAFLGDSVWELYVRRHCIMPPARTTTYYQKTVAQVRAEQQEVYFGVLFGGGFLTDEERDVLRWGGNAKVTVPARFSKSGVHGRTYMHATALECLVGWLYLTNTPRLHELMCHLGLG